MRYGVLSGFAVVPLLIGAILIGGRAVAADPSVPSGPAFLPGESAAECYQDAKPHLEAGKWFERSILQLKEAVRQEPNHPDYLLALGCAEANRVASLWYAETYAIEVPAMKKKYASDLADWQKAQLDPLSDDYGTPRPIETLMPFTPYTKDDHVNYTLTEKQAVSRMKSLGEDAVSRWSAALALVKDPLSRSQYEYVVGWGMEMLARSNDFNVAMYYGDYPSVHVSALPYDRDAIDEFTQATKNDSGNYVNWQSLGDAENLSDDGDQTLAIADYRQALKLHTNNPPLWFCLYLLEYRWDEPEPGISDLRQCIATEPMDAYLLYVLAASDFQVSRYDDNSYNSSDLHDPAGVFTEHQQYDKKMMAQATAKDRQLASEALTSIERANSSELYVRPTYVSPVPALLLAAWDYDERSREYEEAFKPDSKLRNLARVLSGYADGCGAEGNLPEAERSCHGAIGIGMRMLGDWPTEENPDQGDYLIDRLVGAAIAAIGYKGLATVEQLYGTPAAYKSAKDDYDAFTSRVQAYRQAVDDAIGQHMFDHY